MTLEGAIFIVLTFLIGFASFNTGDNALYIIMSFMLSLLIFSGIFAVKNLKGLNIQRSSPKHIYAKTPAEFEIMVSNKKWLFSTFSTEVENYLQNGVCIGAEYILKIPARSFIIKNFVYTFSKRGLYRLGQIKLSSRFPFGFFERSFAMDLQEEAIVYPETIDISDLLIKEKLDMGELASGKKGAGLDLYGLREYAFGDDARHIHWKTSAKKDTLIIREFEKEERKKVSIILLNQTGEDLSSFDVQERFERAVVIAASFAKYFISDDYQTEVLTMSGYIPFGSGEAHLLRIYRALATIEITQGDSLKNKSAMFSNLDNDSRKILIRHDSTVIT